MILSKQKIYSVVVITGLVICLFFYYSIFKSALLLEDFRVQFNAKYFKKQSDISLEGFQMSDSGWFASYVINPAMTELQLRANLLDSGSSEQLINLTEEYLGLLSTRPSWPYYFSGMLQAEAIQTNNFSYIFDNAIRYGPHEKQVVSSIAESLFYNWDNLNKESKVIALNYLSNQSEFIKSLAIGISAKFARVYEFCDFLYDKTHVQSATCKINYWQPLAD